MAKNKKKRVTFRFDPTPGVLRLLPNKEPKVLRWARKKAFDPQWDDPKVLL